MLPMLPNAVDTCSCSVNVGKESKQTNPLEGIPALGFLSKTPTSVLTALRVQDSGSTLVVLSLVWPRGRR